ncbi:MAG TPA: hypothetical protein VJO32_15330 [Ktedonobacteraceae bacterium]|nr:hypothetical protein [Ktedonobacteraceae bacterium]
MTRDFSKHERDDERPYSRNSSSGRQGEERSPRPARPRLNRDTVDKAWENGARQNHSDYRARDTRGGQPTRDNWRRPQQSGQSSAYNSRTNNTGNSRAPYGNRPFDRRQGEHTPNRYQGERPRPFESGMRKFDERQYNQRRDYQPRPESNDSRPREDSRYSNNRPPSRGYEDRRDDRTPRNFQRDDRPQRSFDRDNRQPRSFERNERLPRDFERDDRQPRSFERDERPPRRSDSHEPRPRGYYREQRQERAAGRPDPHNSRWQSRPQRFTPKPRDSARPTYEREQFEGDYEQFDARATSPDVVESRETPRPGRDAARKPREDQQKDAEFMAEVNQQTDSLIEHIVPAEPANEGATDEAASEASPKPKKARTTRARTASPKTKRSRKDDTNPDTPHLRPSHRGFKWPESEQQPTQASEQAEEE